MSVPTQSVTDPVSNWYPVLQAHVSVPLIDVHVALPLHGFDSHSFSAVEI